MRCVLSPFFCRQYQQQAIGYETTCKVETQQQAIRYETTCKVETRQQAIRYETPAKWRLSSKLSGTKPPAKWRLSSSLLGTKRPAQWGPRSLAVRRHPALVCRPSHHAFFSSVPVLPPGRVPGQLRHPGPDVQSQPPAPPDQDPVAHLLHHVLHRPVARAGARQLPVAAERRPARPGQHHPHRAAVHDSREGGAAQQGQARAAAQTPQVPIGPRKVQAAEQVQAERWASVCLDVRLSRCPSV